MDKIIFVPNQEVFNRVSSHYKGLFVNLMPHKKILSCMMELFVNFINPGELVVYFFLSTFGVVKTFLLLPKHHRLVGYDN